MKSKNVTVVFIIIAILFLMIAIFGKKIFEFAPTVGWFGAILSILIALVYVLFKRNI